MYSCCVAMVTTYSQIWVMNTTDDILPSMAENVTSGLFSNDTCCLPENSTSGPPPAGNGRPPIGGSMEEVILWQSAIFGFGGTVICCIGIPCNITAIVVLAHYGKRSSAPFLLICLAVSDSLFLVSMLFLEALSSLTLGGYIDESYKRHSFRLAYCLFYTVPMTAHMMSVYTVVTITLERYVVVVRPFLAQILCSFRSACISIAAVVVFAVLYHIPYHLAYYRDYGTHPNTGEKVLRLWRTEFGGSYFFTQVYVKWLSPAVTFLIPFLVLLIFNSMMIFTLKRKKRQMVTSQAQNRGQSENRLTMMVLCMTAVFFIIELFAAITFVLVTGFGRYEDLPHIALRINVVSDLGLVLNSSINFAIYCASGKKFRETFRLVCLNYYRKLKSHICACARLQTGERHAGITSVQLSTNSRSKTSSRNARKRKMFAKIWSRSSQFSSDKESSSGFTLDTAVSRLSREENHIVQKNQN